MARKGVENALNELSADDLLLPLGDNDARTYGAEHVLALAALAAGGGRGAVAAGCAAGADAARLSGHGRAPPRPAWRCCWCCRCRKPAPTTPLALKAALDTRLAYVITGLPDVDAMSQAGLTGLGSVLKARTSYEPQEPVGVDPERDDLSFYPLLYWPMDPREKNLSPGGAVAAERLYAAGRHHPVRHPRSDPGRGDRRQFARQADLAPPDRRAWTCRRWSRCPPIMCCPSHFISCATFPAAGRAGRSGSKRCRRRRPAASSAPARGGDGVSPVIIGGNDWAAAWAVDPQGRPLAEPVPGGESQREMAFRFGINLVMYALTGNYKTDQVHAAALLERMGR